MIEPATWSSNVGRRALHALVKIVAAKGGALADIAVGDAVEYLAALKAANDRSTGYTLFYAWLKELGTLPARSRHAQLQPDRDTDQYGRRAIKLTN
ncbi:hypothetical protein AB0D78_27100 [Streptomyces avermitilis]|uniref:hypothetical protein n=1 Tax=Streptomyces avermitilis TaxID=33903 RepID=UPI0033C54040